MAFDKTQPPGSKKIRLSDELIRANWEALETAISEGHRFSTGGTQDGKHVTPTFVDNGGAPGSDPSSNERILYNNGGTMKIRDNGGTDHVLAPIELNTVMVFKQSSSPAKWTFQSEDNDKVLLNTSTEAEGGDTGGSWSPTGSTDSESGHTHTVSRENWGRTQCSPGSITAERLVVGSGSTEVDEGLESLCAAANNQTTTTNGSHSHSVTIESAWRPAYAKVITCKFTG